MYGYKGKMDAYAIYSFSNLPDEAVPVIYYLISRGKK